MVRRPPDQQVPLVRPFLRRGVPPFFYRYDQGFLHWLYWTGKTVEFLSETRPRDALRRRPREGLRPDRLPGPQRVRDDARVRRDRALPQPRRQPDLPLGEQLLLAGDATPATLITRETQWRDLGRPEAALIGVQYLANDRGERQGVFVLLDRRADWLWAGTGLVRARPSATPSAATGSRSTTSPRDSPPGTTVVAEIPDLFGPGLTAEMTYYETTNGAKVFAAGTLDFGGSASTCAGRADAREPLGARSASPSALPGFDHHYDDRDNRERPLRRESSARLAAQGHVPR